MDMMGPLATGNVDGWQPKASAASALLRKQVGAEVETPTLPTTGSGPG